jgi:hypothetical protein
MLSVCLSGGVSVEEQTVGINPEAAALQRWKASITLGRFNFRAGDIGLPPPEFGARGVNTPHVLDVAQGILEHATIPGHIFSVSVDTELHTLCLSQGLLGNTDLNYRPRSDAVKICQLQTQPTAKDLADMFAAIGAHSTLAVDWIENVYPGNILAVAPATWAVAPYTKETIDNLTALGLMDNAYVRRTTDWVSFVKGLHTRRFASTDCQDEKTAKAYAAAAKLMVKKASKKSDGTINAWWQLAKRDGEYWQLIEQCLDGDFVIVEEIESAEWEEAPKKPIRNTVPSSVDPFQKLGGIPDDQAIMLLRKVRRNELNWKEFGHKCMLYKNSIVVMEYVAQFLSGLKLIPPLPKITKKQAGSRGGGRPSAEDTTRAWVSMFNDHVGAKYPLQFGSSFVTQWAASIGSKKKNQIPDHFKDQITKVWNLACTLREEKASGNKVGEAHAVACPFRLFD